MSGFASNGRAVHRVYPHNGEVLGAMGLTIHWLTVLFTDIVDSTARATAVGDRAWRALLKRHHAIVRAEIARHRGREVNMTGDGFVVCFEDAARAVRCALAITAAVRRLGLEIRAGVHAGDCYLEGDEISGIALHIGARITVLAAPGEVLVSSTVRDLVPAGAAFAHRGAHRLKGCRTAGKSSPRASPRRRPSRTTTACIVDPMAAIGLPLRLRRIRRAGSGGALGGRIGPHVPTLVGQADLAERVGDRIAAVAAKRLSFGPDRPGLTRRIVAL